MSSFTPSRQWSLRAQVRWSVCLLVAALAVGGGEWLARHDATLARQDAGNQQLQVAHDMAERLSQEMAARARDVQLLSELDELRQFADADAARKALERLKATLSSYAWLGITDREGTVLVATDGVLVGQSIATRPVFLNGIQGLWTGDVHDAALLAKLAPHPAGESVKFVDVAAPLRGPDGTVRGALALHLSWEWAEQLRQSVLRPRGASRSLQLMIVDARGQVLLPAEKGISNTVLQLPRIAALGERWGVETWSDGQEALTSVAESRPLGDFLGFGWRVVARDTQAAAATSVQAARPGAYGWALGAGALAALVACWVIGRVVAPVEQLARSLQPPGSPAQGGGPRSQRRSDVQQIAAAVTRLQATVKERDDSIDQLADKARRDPLTGVWNRGYLPDMTESLRVALADGTSETCVLCVDLDGFKEVNDRYGHAAGDEVLVQAARRLRQAARAGDPVFRLGGDEFMLLLTCPVGEAAGLARSIAGRVLAELQRPMSYRTLSNLRITASVGGAVWSNPAEPLADTIAHADEALYAAKHSGRGMFRLYAGMPAPEAQGPSPRLRA